MPPKSWWLEKEEENVKVKDNLYASIGYSFYAETSEGVLLSFTGDGIVVNTTTEEVVEEALGGFYKKAKQTPNNENYLLPSLKWETIANKCSNETSLKFFSDNQVRGFFSNLVPNLLSYATNFDRGGYISFAYIAKDGKKDDNVGGTSTINCGECGVLISNFVNDAMLLARRHFTKQ